MIVIKGKLCLYFRERSGKNNSYLRLIESMDDCINSDYNHEKSENLIELAQVVLSEVWIRMKREAGITEKDDAKFEKMFESVD